MDVVSPATVDEVASALREAAGAGATVLARGSGSKLHWGNPVTCDRVVDLRGLDRIIDHAAGDMVVRVQAGVPLARLAAEIAAAGQQLALDPLVYDDGRQPGGTVGGALAVGLGGPRRLRYGRLRDLLLGVTMVRADGVIASSGGRVVKNVAGYDLGKLLCGSYGTLGVIATATLRLHPLPAATGWVATTTADPLARAAALLDSQLMPSAVELDRPVPGGPVTVAALFEGTASGVAARSGAAAGLIEGDVLAEPPGWSGRWPGSPSGTLIRLACPPARLADALGAVDAAAEPGGLPVRVRGSAGLAELLLGLPADLPADSLRTFLSALRDRLAEYGSAVVVHHPDPGADGRLVDVWGPVDRGALGLMNRVKEQFDPDRRLAPGRFVGSL